MGRRRYVQALPVRDACLSPLRRDHRRLLSAPA